MSILAALMFFAVPEPLSLEPFMDEERAAHAMEEHIACLGNGSFDRRNDIRAANVVAAEVVKQCSEKATRMQTALADVYLRKPSLLPAGANAEDAAKAYVGEMNARSEQVINNGRKHK